MSTTISFLERFLRLWGHGPESRVSPYPLDSLDTLSESKYLVADSGGVPAYRSSRLSLPANSWATSLQRTLSPFLTNTHLVPTISFWIILSALAGDTVPHTHVGHKP